MENVDDREEWLKTLVAAIDLLLAVEIAVDTVSESPARDMAEAWLASQGDGKGGYDGRGVEGARLPFGKSGGRSADAWMPLGVNCWRSSQSSSSANDDRSMNESMKDE